MHMRSYMLVIKDVRTAQERHLLAQHIIVCHGILGRQYLPEVRPRHSGTAHTLPSHGLQLLCVMLPAGARPGHQQELQGGILHGRPHAWQRLRCEQHEHQREGATVLRWSKQLAASWGWRPLDQFLALWGQSVVIVGGGAFACEAMRSAVLNGASSITMITREKSKQGPLQPAPLLQSSICLIGTV